MKTQIDTSGFDDFKKKLQNLSGSVALTDLYPDEFIARNTDFASLQEMVDAGGFESPDFLDTQEWADFAASRSRFATWQEMNEAAIGEYAKRKLGT